MVTLLATPQSLNHHPTSFCKSYPSLARFSFLSVCPHFPLSLPATRPRSPSLSSVNVNAIAAEGKKKKVLIVNANSGGHAIIGFYFAKELLELGHDVTVMTVGEENSSKMKKPPFNRFSEISRAGGRTVWGRTEEMGDIVEETQFDAVLDNNGKDVHTVRAVADWAMECGVKQFLYISSAGIYKPTDEPPHVEGDVVKDDATHIGAESYIAKNFTTWAIFRPQYIIGSGNNKDCEEWFFDRIVRKRAVPIPGCGMQITNIVHVRDVSSMLTLAVEKADTANRNVFNCVSDRGVTLDGVAKLCAEATGLNLQIVHYDPTALGIDAKKAFPFRNMHFYAEPRGAKEILGWECSSKLGEDLKERYDEYIKSGRDKMHIEFELDDQILESLKLHH